MQEPGHDKMSNPNRAEQLKNTNIGKKLAILLNGKDQIVEQMDRYKSQIKVTDVEEDQLQKIVEGRDINVAIRSRPLLDYELNEGYYETCYAKGKSFHFMEPKLNIKEECILNKPEAH